MRMGSSLVVVVVMLAGLPAFAQAAGDACAADDAIICKDTSSLFLCDDATLQLQEVACSVVEVGTTCGPMPCAGEGCATFVGCAAERGGACNGVGPFFDTDPDNDRFLMSGPCRGNSACTFNSTAQTDTCTALPAGIRACVVGDPFVRCEGTRVVACDTIGTTTVVTSPAVYNCAEEGLVCIEDDDGVSCGEPPVAEGEGEGEGPIGEGEGEGPIGEGEGEGEAPIGEGEGEGETPIGEGEGETPIGEGEGEDECGRDSDCDDDEECNDGRCERVRTRRPSSDDDEAPAGLFSCASGSGAGPVALAALVLLRRRRRA